MIVPLEDQVTSRQISEELKSRGVPQKSLFYHVCYVDMLVKSNSFYLICSQGEIDYQEEFGMYSVQILGSAYTVSEIFAMLTKQGISRGFYAYDPYETTPDSVALDLLREIDSGRIRVGDL